MLVGSGLLAVSPPTTPVGAAGALTNPTWTASPTTTKSTNVANTYGFTTATTASLDSVTMSVPTGTAGTPTVGTVTPASVAAGGTVTLAGTTLTYSFTAASISAGIRVSIQINGLTNTATAGTYTSTIATRSSGTTIDTGTTPGVTLTAQGLTSPTWSLSSTAVGATGVSYSYTFTTSGKFTLASVTMTVPAGTSGTPTVGPISGLPTGGTVTLSGTTLTYAFTATSINTGIAVSIQINGITNTTVAGSYAAEIVTKTNTGTAADSGTTAAVVIVGSLTLTAPASLTWAATLNGANQSVVDTNAADQQFTVADTTATGAGWHITVSATTPTTGVHALPASGTLVYTGSITSVSATTAPSSLCSGTCTLPTNLTTYPVAITTAVSAPPTFTLYDTKAGSGLGTIIIGSHTSADPGGWWINLPANSFAGTYASTITLAVVSAP